jgi:SOS-response transcriptional repressor LexA
MSPSKIQELQKLSGQGPDAMTVYYQVSKQAFAMNVADNALAPRLNRHDIAVIEPARIPQPGQCVAARVKGMADAIVRIYHALPSGEGKRQPFELAPINRSFRRLHSSRESIRILGTVVARQERLI